MATHNPKNKTHRDLVESTCLYLAERERETDPELSMSRALARGRRSLAIQLDVSRENINDMRRRNSVARWHWPKFEQLTGGRIKASDFEQATHE